MIAFVPVIFLISSFATVMVFGAGIWACAEAATLIVIAKSAAIKILVFPIVFFPPYTVCYAALREKHKAIFFYQKPVGMSNKTRGLRLYFAVWPASGGVDGRPPSIKKDTRPLTAMETCCYT